MERSNLQTAAMLLGVVFLVVGIAGFIPGITTDYERLGEFGEPGAKVLGIFAVNWLHNLAHLAFGVAGVVLARTLAGARAFLIVGGAIYLVLWLYGLVIAEDSAANIIAQNTADTWLHFVLGVAMVGLGIVLGRPAERAAPA